MSGMVDLVLGVEQERRRILGIIWSEFRIYKISGDERIAMVLNALAIKIEHDHNQDSEQ